LKKQSTRAPYPEWHRKEKENILSNEGEYKGTFKTVGDKEHAEIIRLYMEEELSIDKIAKHLNRSSRTPLMQINKHNATVERSGFCPTCRRVRSKYESQLAQRPMTNTTTHAP